MFIFIFVYNAIAVRQGVQQNRTKIRGYRKSYKLEPRTNTTTTKNIKYGKFFLIFLLPAR